ncbi:hypothetical protein ECANGB1_1278 [Enterospora canceri]|uniref:Uncharacterized protein n=1 Tax=Enterospora canceri TaxID=1081671 RepID=A0A1Y1S6C8_9MICR|nr:hypothetical protein ECANGB1_1278 [Enterospora canceri]
MEAKETQEIFMRKENTLEILKGISREQVVQITCNITIVSICTVEILRNILEKELIKYELKFEKMNYDVAFTMRSNQKLIILDNSRYSKELCRCSSILSGCYGMYNLAKQLNFVNHRIVWPFLVAHEFNVTYDFTKEYCSWCSDIGAELVSQAKRTKKVNNMGIEQVELITLPFIYESSLFDAIQNDLKTVCKKKLFSGQNKENKANCNRKIYEFLAKEGISIAVAHETYKNIDYEQNENMEYIFGTETSLIFVHEHSFKIRPIEHYILISHFLHNNNPLNAFFSLSKKEYYMNTGYLNMIMTLMNTFKNLAKGMKKVENTMIFFEKLKTDHFVSETDQIDTNVLFILLKMTRIYLRFKFENDFDHVLVLKGNDVIYLVSIAVGFEGISHDKVLERDDIYIKIKKNDLKQVLRDALLKDDE